MIVGGRCTIKGIAGWKGRKRASKGCARDKLPRKDKTILARMVRRAINRSAQVALIEESHVSHTEPPRKNVGPRRYASSTDF